MKQMGDFDDPMKNGWPNVTGAVKPSTPAKGHFSKQQTISVGRGVG